MYEWDGHVYLHRPDHKIQEGVQRTLDLLLEFDELISKKELQRAIFKRDVRVGWLESQRDKESDEHKKDWDEVIAKQGMLFPGGFDNATDGTSEGDGSEGMPEH